MTDRRPDYGRHLDVKRALAETAHRAPTDFDRAVEAVASEVRQAKADAREQARLDVAAERAARERHALASVEKVSATYHKYVCACGAEGYATAPGHLATSAWMARRVKINHGQHAKRAVAKEVRLGRSESGIATGGPLATVTADGDGRVVVRSGAILGRAESAPRAHGYTTMGEARDETRRRVEAALRDVERVRPFPAHRPWWMRLLRIGRR